MKKILSVLFVSQILFNASISFSSNKNVKAIIDSGAAQHGCSSILPLDKNYFYLDHQPFSCTLSRPVKSSDPKKAAVSTLVVESLNMGYHFHMPTDNFADQRLKVQEHFVEKLFKKLDQYPRIIFLQEVNPALLRYIRHSGRFTESQRERINQQSLTSSEQRDLPVAYQIFAQKRSALNIVTIVPASLGKAKIIDPGFLYALNVKGSGNGVSLGISLQMQAREKFHLFNHHLVYKTDQNDVADGMKEAKKNAASEKAISFFAGDFNFSPSVAFREALSAEGLECFSHEETTLSRHCSK